MTQVGVLDSCNAELRLEESAANQAYQMTLSHSVFDNASHDLRVDLHFLYGYVNVFVDDMITPLFAMDEVITHDLETTQSFTFKTQVSVGMRAED